MSSQMPNPNEVMDVEQLRQKLASIEHQRWSDWQEYMFDCAVTSGTDEGIGYRVLGWPKEQYDHWQRQIETSYADLSDKEKASDMEQVDRYWPLVESYVAQQNAALLQDLLKHKEQWLTEDPIDGSLIEKVSIPASILEAKLNEITKEVK